MRWEGEGMREGRPGYRGSRMKEAGRRKTWHWGRWDNVAKGYRPQVGSSGGVLSTH